MSKYDNLLSGKDQTIKAYRIGLFITLGLAILMGAGWMRSPSEIKIHIPPDLSNGAIMSIDEIGKGNVYAFTLYIWQQLNRWEKDGVTDYEDKIFMLKNYMTPQCYQDRLEDFALKKSRHELDRRERSVWEIPGRSFDRQRVLVESSGTWVVYLDMHINETMMGEVIKDRYVNYPIRVVRYNVDPETNAWGLAIDCFADKPRVIEMKEVMEDK